MTSRPLPRDNPFEPLPPERLATIYHWPPEALRFVAGEADCLQVVGDAGLGKTALLQQLELRFAASGLEVPYTVVPTDGALDPDEVAMGGVTLLDEADRWPERALRQFLTRVRAARQRLALASHRDHRRALRRGRLTALHIALAPLTQADDVARFFEDRVALAAPEARPTGVLSEEAAEALLRLSGGNLERCLQIGYEVFEDLGKGGGQEPAGSSATIEAADIRRAAESLAQAHSHT